MGGSSVKMPGAAVGLWMALGTLAMAQTTQGPQTIQAALRGLEPTASLRLIGGTPAKEGAWPWQVLIHIPIMKDGKQGFHRCGGSLVASRWVLTAAHCVTAQAPESVDRPGIRVVESAASPTRGAFADPSRWVMRQIEDMKLADYKPQTNENDIALLQLREPLRSKPVAMLLVPNRKLEDVPTIATVTGWGQLLDVNPLADGTYVDPRTGRKFRPDELDPETLMQVELPLVALSDCKARNRNAPGVVDERNLCAGILPQGGKDSCRGDSGGPMVVDRGGGSWIQIGIVSWGVGCGRPSFPGAYTRISAFADWVRNAIGRDLVVTPDEIASDQSERPQIAPEQGAPELAPETQASSAFNNAAGLRISFDKGDMVHVGDVVSYRVTTHQPGYLAIFDAGPDGKLTQVYPNARSLASPTGARPEAARISPERPLLIPNAGNSFEGFQVRIKEPRGQGLMVAVLRDKPLQVVDIPAAPKTFDTPTQALAAIERLRKELIVNATVNPSGALDPNWSVAIAPYTIQ
jgi:secreted trypsin-like serine protease